MARPTKAQQAVKAALLYKTEVACWRMACPEQARALKGNATISIPVRAAVAQWKRCDPEGTDAAIKNWRKAALILADEVAMAALEKKQLLHKRARLQATREIKALKIKMAKRK